MDRTAQLRARRRHDRTDLDDLVDPRRGHGGMSLLRRRRRRRRRYDGFRSISFQSFGQLIEDMLWSGIAPLASNEWYAQGRIPRSKATS